MIICLCLFLLCWILDGGLRSKRALAAWYDISLQTLAKWVDHFTEEISLAEYAALGKSALPPGLELRLLRDFGLGTRVPKHALAEALATDTDGLRRDVRAGGHLIGVRAGAYAATDLLPPRLAGAIAAHVAI